MFCSLENLKIATETGNPKYKFSIRSFLFVRPILNLLCVQKYKRILWSLWYTAFTLVIKIEANPMKRSRVQRILFECVGMHCIRVVIAVKYTKKRLC